MIMRPTIPINKDIALPVYRRIEEDLRARVRDGRWSTGSRIPPRRELAKQYNVEVNTIQRAIAILLEDGVLRADPGKGTFVSDNADLAATAKNGAPANAPSLRLGIALGDAEALSDADGYGLHVVRGVRRALAPYGLKHSVTFVENWDTDMLAAISRSDLSGILLVSPDTEKRTQISQLWHAGMPTVVVTSSWPGIDVPFIDCDNYAGVRAAVSHLVSLGHKRIGCGIIHMNLSNHRDRAEAFRRVLREYGLEVAPEHVIERWRPTNMEGQAAIRTLLSSPNRPTALILLDDQTATRTLPIACKLGIRVPQDLSLITFDDTRAAMHAEPPLTTVAPPFEEMGQKAAEMLLAMCAGQPFTKSPDLMPMSFIERRSTARAVLCSEAGEAAPAQVYGARMGAKRRAKPGRLIKTSVGLP
ncbi:MAG: GntR family transcriptional regulator [Capsulimonadaceae bacterium]|nr:GntR family transcriptional regulator [Capsulimonadaceae bacterium]